MEEPEEGGKEEEERWYICFTCRRLLPTPEFVVCRVFWREFRLCSHECWVDFCRGQ